MQKKNRPQPETVLITYVISQSRSQLLNPDSGTESVRQTTDDPAPLHGDTPFLPACIPQTSKKLPCL